MVPWRSALGDEYVVTERSACSEAEAATYAASQKISAIIRPGSREELQECLRIANHFQTPVYPVSAGKNWGYGSRVPASDGCVLILLDRLNRIVDYDEALGYLTVEPGVTFAEARRFLREHDSALMLKSPGSTDEASIIGNVVERGIAAGLDGERVEQVCGLEIVLPCGECVHTGFARFPNAAAAAVSTHGVGPSLDGLFLQSNLGIVTKLTHWLSPLPKFRQYFTFSLRSADRLAELVDALQRIKREDVVHSSISLHNTYKVLTNLGRVGPSHPADRMVRLEELTAKEVESAKSYAWTGEGVITGPDEASGSARRKLLENMLAESVDKLTFAQPGTNNAMVGVPDRTGLASIYWRKPSPPPETMDPDKDRCGLIWVTPIARFQGTAVARCVGLIEATMDEFAFEPIIGVQCHSMRAVHVVASIIYDRDKHGHDARALACHDTLLKQLVGEGFVPYRLSTHAMRFPSPSEASYLSLLKKLKAAVDPAGILAPGRYEW